MSELWTSEEICTVRQLVPPKWRVHLLPGVHYNLAGDKPVPNAFHRLMQRLILGIKWERVKK